MEATEKRFVRRTLVTAGILGMLSVMLGAFGAHGLKNQIATGSITAEQVNGFDTGVKYQMYHTLALLGLAASVPFLKQRFLSVIFWFFVAGILLFSGSLYLLTTRGITGWTALSFLGPVTPVGGLFFVAGWLTLLMAAIKGKQ